MAPAHHKLDIRHVVVRHTEDVVSIRAVVWHLTRPRGDESFGLSGYVKVQGYPSAWRWEVTFDEDHPRESGDLRVLDAEHFEQLGCVGTDDGLRARANYDRNWVAVIIPRSCLAITYQIGRRDPARGRPAHTVYPPWVQVSVGTVHGLGLDRPYWMDYLGAQVQVEEPFLGLEDSHFTPRLYRG